jgi:hypothetical protein
MYCTSRKGNSSQSGRDVINSRKADQRVRRGEQSTKKQNEIDMNTLNLLEDISDQIVNEGLSSFFLTGKYLDMYFSNEDNPKSLTNEEINRVNSLIPKGDNKIRFIEYVHSINSIVKKTIYYILIILIIAEAGRRGWIRGRPRVKNSKLLLR